MFPRKSFGEKLAEWIIGLIVLGIVTEVVIGYLVALIPYILGGLVALGVGALCVRRFRQW